MKSYEHLSYDPVGFADELAKLDVMIAEKVKELKLEKQEAENEKKIFTLAANFYKRDSRNERGQSERNQY